MSSATQTLEAFLELNQPIKYIRFQWVDYCGVLRARFVPIARSLRIASGDETMGLAQNSMITPTSTAPIMFSLTGHHESWQLLPDWSSLRRCGSSASHATVMCFVDQKEAQSRLDKCPRKLLIQTLERLENEWATKALIGFEIEIVLLDEFNNLVRPMDRLNGYARTAGLRAETLDLVEEIVDALNQASISVHHFHPEIQDQLEIALTAEPALRAADSLVLAQEIIRTICVRRKLRATMTPRPTFTGPTSGVHLHLSLSNVERVSADHFLAGVLGHMGSLCAFGMANYDGYVRATGDAAGAWIGFGTDNRDLPVRKVNEWHWEFRMMDSTANPYLFTAAVLLAAMDGLETKAELTWKDCNLFPSRLDAERRAQYGLDKRMPATFKEALECLKSDAAVPAWVGGELLRWYISVKDREAEEYGKMTDEQRRLKFLEYF